MPETRLTCPTCGASLAAGEVHGLHDYKDLKFRLDGYMKPGQSMFRNVLFDELYAGVPQGPDTQVMVYNYEIAPGAFTNWHIHTGAQFYLTLEGQFESHFKEGVLIRSHPGNVYSEPMNTVHRGHNPHGEITLRGIALNLTTPGQEPIINVEAPDWAPPP